CPSSQAATEASKPATARLACITVARRSTLPGVLNLRQFGRKPPIVQRGFLDPKQARCLRMVVSEAINSDKLLGRDLCGAGARLPFCPGPREHALHADVPLMAGVLVDTVSRADQRNQRRPRTRPGGRIFSCELIIEPIGAQPREPFDQVEVRARST